MHTYSHKGNSLMTMNKISVPAGAWEELRKEVRGPLPDSVCLVFCAVVELPITLSLLRTVARCGFTHLGPRASV